MPSEDSKPVKKEDDYNDEDKISTFKKVTKSNAKPPQSNKVSKLKKVPKQETEPIPHATSASRSKVKNEVNDDDYDEDEDDEKPIAKKISKTKVVKKVKKVMKKVKKEEKVVVTEEKKKIKKERKVYDLPGQKRDPPEERDPLRIFYESLHEQIPTSEMAQIWLMESGLLPKEVAKKVFEKKQKKAMQQKVTSSVKAGTPMREGPNRCITVKKASSTTPNSSAKKKTTNSKSKPTKKRKSESISSEDDDSDFDVGSATTKKRKVA
ncbi:hypothetical protein TSUD_312150 [Trifolium subterraneum]|uniref:Uncharacterized protein n=1 Tax=Trifolium subterraneum TaxID=3900 RepID=A0A2Z6MNA8_TRISU|nr:hypothetical protein TSUD_312150 [Trifolium subterraneum]